ncbi:MAG: hypothetical protein OEY34_06540 [Cyclobacteriaceae bacterium]|nr:hypothetical protein [Cyclobacteriaceae bacterium]
MRKTRDFGQKINATFEFIRQNFKSLFTVLLYIAGPVAALYSAFMVLTVNNMTGIFQRMISNPDPEEFLSVEFLSSTGLTLLFSVLSYTFIYATVLEYMNVYLEKKGNGPIEVSEVWDRVKNSIVTIILAGFFLLFAFILLGVAVVVVVSLLAFIPVINFLGFLALAIVLIYISITLSLFYVVLVIEKTPLSNLTDVIRRCFFLVKDKWWSTFGLLFVMSLIVAFAGGMLQMPISFAQFFKSIDSLESEDPMAMMSVYENPLLLAYLGIVQFINVLLQSVTLLALVFQYFNLVELKEAKGLMSEIEEVTSTDTSDEEENETY